VHYPGLNTFCGATAGSSLGKMVGYLLIFWGAGLIVANL